MKKYLSIFLFVSALCFISCSSNEQMLRGYWCYEHVSETSAYYMRYELHEDFSVVRYQKTASRTGNTDEYGYTTYSPWKINSDKSRSGSWKILMDNPSFPQLLMSFDDGLTLYQNLLLYDGGYTIKFDDKEYYKYDSYDYIRPSF